MERNDADSASPSPFGAGVPERHAPPPTPPQEVEAVPLSPSEARGPTVDVRGERAAPPPPIPPNPPTPAPTIASASDAPPASPPNQPPPTAPVVAAPPRPTANGRVWVILCHLAYLIPTHLPGLIVTTLIWVWRRRRDPTVEDQGREAINMQLNFFAVNALLLLTFNCITTALTPLVWVIGAVMCVIASVKSGEQERYRYPWIFRVIV